MSDIANEVGINKASLYYFHRDKQALFLSVISDIHSELEALLDEMDQSKNTKSALRDFILKVITVLQKQGALLNPIDPSQFDTSDNQFVAALESSRVVVRKTQKFLKRCGVAQPKLATKILFATTQGYSMQRQCGASEATPSQIAAYMATLLIK